MSERNFGRHESLSIGGFFASHPKVLATIMGPAKVWEHEVALISNLENYMGHFVFITRFLGDLFY